MSAHEPIESSATSARTITVGGREFLYFGGCSYLGLAHDERVIEAASRALHDFGASTSAARGTSGTTVLHRELEAELADFARAEDCALLPDAGLADLAVALACVERGARVLVDDDAHPCILDALAAAGARVDFGRDADHARLGGCTAAFTDGTFPTAARRADVAALRAARFELLAIDDAHGFGVLGERGAGAAEQLDLASDDQILVVALSKGLGATGGAVLGSRKVVAAVRATSPFSNTTAPAPAQTAAALAALRIVRGEPERRARLLSNTARLHAIVDRFEPRDRAIDFPVRAFSCAEEGRVERVHAALLERGLCVPLVHYHGGPAREYLRFAVSAAHTDTDLDRLESALMEATSI